MKEGDAIHKKEGPCVILAGAGTGKTYTIVEKLKYLIGEKVYSPERVVCITFSNEAANNLILRVGKSLSLDKNDGLVIRTFHGFSADLLRRYGSKIGINEKFKILNPDEAKVVLHRNLKINVGNCHKYIGTIGTAKDLGIKLENFENYLKERLEKYKDIDLEKRLENLQFQLQTLYLSERDSGKKDIVNQVISIRNLIELKKFVSAWQAYEKLKEKKNYQDYSDLNNNSLKLLKGHPEISEDFDYVIVDEFQDTNKVQLEFLIALAKKRNITVVGDLNQSIYRFRGAYRQNFALFKHYFDVKDSEIYNLDKSFRSPNSVLKIAHKLILNNYENKEDCFFVENAFKRDGDRVKVFELKNAKEEARKILEIIKSEIDAGVRPEEICVLFRAHQHGRIIKKVLDYEGIEYCSVSKANLLKQKSIRMVIDYLKILDKIKRKDKSGEGEWWDLAYQSEFSNEDLIKIGKYIKICKKECEVQGRDNNGNGIICVKLLNNFDKLDLSDSGKLASKILIEKIKLLLPSSLKSCSELVQEVYNISGLVNGQKGKNVKETVLNLNKFYELAKTHEELYDSDLQNFLYYLEVLESLGIEIEAAELEDSGVRLMTSHATKGLEFKVVILSNLAQKRFPIERYSSNSLIPTALLPEVKNEISKLNVEDGEDFIKEYEKYHQLMEERRLCYVSFTRAKEKLILTYAKDYGNRKFYPSQFLDEITYKNNPDVSFGIDNEEKYFEDEVEIKNALSFDKALGASNFDEVLTSIVENTSRKGLLKEAEHQKFSPSALLLFEECQKKFEYKYVYNMPEKKSLSWEEMRLGTFVHLILETGVSENFSVLKEFEDLAKEMHVEEDWESVNLEDALLLTKVFYERNKGKYSEKSKTEQYLKLNLAGMEFIGFADRIDFHSDGIEIVDYKTGKSYIQPKNRNWQLGFYALAAANEFGNVKKVTLDLLKQEKPLEFEIDEKGNAVAVNSDRMQGFNIYEVEQELIMAAHSVQEAYKKGFKSCSIEKNCEFCNEYVYGL